MKLSRRSWLLAAFGCVVAACVFGISKLAVGSAGELEHADIGTAVMPPEVRKEREAFRDPHFEEFVDAALLGMLLKGHRISKNSLEETICEKFQSDGCPATDHIVADVRASLEERVGATPGSLKKLLLHRVKLSRGGGTDRIEVSLRNQRTVATISLPDGTTHLASRLYDHEKISECAKATASSGASMPPPCRSQS